MQDVSRVPRQKSWKERPKHVSVLAEMALRRENVTARLLSLRERNGLSQEQAAQKVGITHRQWQRWETGESMPYPRNLDAVASAFGISITEFFDPEPIVRPIDADQLDRIERKVDALLQHAKLDPATFDADPVADIEKAAASSTEVLSGEAKAKPEDKPTPARKRRAS